MTRARKLQAKRTYRQAIHAHKMVNKGYTRVLLDEVNGLVAMILTRKEIQAIEEEFKL